MGYTGNTHKPACAAAPWTQIGCCGACAGCGALGRRDYAMLKKARIVSMIVLAASVVVTAGMAVENLVLACLALARKRERH